MKENEKRIFNAIKTDDVVLFSSLIIDEELLAIRFGRFPILSLLYLYESKKIIKDYEKKLIEIKNYSEIDEPQELFIKFRQVAKKSLRLYVIEKNIVSPLEMLAILEESGVLQHLYKEVKKTDKITKNIAKIYDLNHNQIIKQEDDKMRARRKKLPKYKISIIAIAMLVATLFIVAFPFMSTAIGKAYGDGSELYPYNVYTAEQFMSALSQKDAKVIIKRDIIITDYELFGSDFDGIIDAEGHNITFEGYDGKTLFNTFGGKFVNGNVIIDNASISVKGDFAIFAKVNNGEIDGVNLKFNANITATSEKADGEVLTLSAYAVDNNGIIENCNVFETVNIVGNGKDIFYATFTANNKKTLANLKILKDSKITTQVVDVAGVAYKNIEGGTITNVETNAVITQTSVTESWSPNVSGIVFENRGQLTSCKNLGELSATTSSNVGSAMVAGIVMNNKKDILYCENNANLSAKSAIGDLYVAGIAAYNEGQITRSVVRGTLTGEIQSGDKGFALIGGIVVENMGILEKCVSGATFNLTAAKQYFGGVSVAVLADITFDIDGIKPAMSEKYKSIDCYFLTQELIKNDNAILFLMISGDGQVSKQLTDIVDDRGGVTRVATMDELLGIIERLYETR